MLDLLEDLSQALIDIIGDVIESLGWKGPIFGVLILLAFSACVVISHLLGSYALSRIAKGQGARRKMEVLCWVPFFRYYAVGKLSERCDARRGKEFGPWSKLAIRVGIPVMLVAGLLFWMALILFVGFMTFLFLLFFMESVDLGEGFFAEVARGIALVFVAIVFLLASLLSDFSYLLIIVPIILAVLCAVLSVVLGAVGLAISYVCYAKILREYFRSPALGVLIAVSAVLGLFPITLLIASFREPLPAVAYNV